MKIHKRIDEIQEQLSNLKLAPGEHHNEIKASHSEKERENGGTILPADTYHSCCEGEQWIGPVQPPTFYQNAMTLVDGSQGPRRTLRTELLGCHGDEDYLAKLYCVRKAFELMFKETSTRMFFRDAGRAILTGLVVLGRKTPCKFENMCDNLIAFIEEPSNWNKITEELSATGVENLNFFDVVFDFILLKIFEEMETAPASLQEVMDNDWITESMKKTTIMFYCWGRIKALRTYLNEPFGFFYHLYEVLDYILPELVWGCVGPEGKTKGFYHLFKEQVYSFLKDIFNLQKVSYTTVELLVEDIVKNLKFRTEMLTCFLQKSYLK
nr:PREDICTED: protein FAM73A-like isoform X2 [Latimeria chalumnae]XP_014350599.1 PREDICTED: protein FAM73A-like isoform X2 [Latimeria chalumnae]|eukprot:XP_014350598.1 PREDICTED: protein FAM73A-like isoform X2 [Latimeria chalumnae]